MSTDFTPSKRLLADRDYYRAMADGTFTSRYAVSLPCEWGGCDRCEVSTCGHPCHRSDAERDLFRRLADEIDGFLQPAAGQDALPT